MDRWFTARPGRSGNPARTRRRRPLAAMALAVTAAVCVPVAPASAETPIFAQGNPVSFGPATNLNFDGTRGSAVAIGDLNGDGKPDLATAIRSQGLAVFLSTGGGSFGPVAKYPAPIGPFSSSPFVITLAIGDLNGDGRPDIAGANSSDDFAVVWLNTGGGAFAPGAVVELNERPNCGNSSSNPCQAAFQFAVVIGDFDEDGKPDLATANGNTDNVTLVRGNGDGTFGPATQFGLAGGDSPTQLIAADLNTDGHLDLVTVNNHLVGANSGLNGTLSVLLGDGNGSFATSAPVASGILLANRLALADVDEDGNVDAVVTSGAAIASIGVLRGNGAGGFGPATTFPVTQGEAFSNPAGLGAGDLNGDGHADLVITASRSDSVLVFPGDGSGRFDIPPSSTGLNGADNPGPLGVGDLDGDGRLDVVTANQSSSSSDVRDVSVLLNTTPAPPAAMAELGANVGAFLQLSGGSASFGTLKPSLTPSSYLATAQLTVLSTYPGLTVYVTAASANTDLGGAGEVTVQPIDQGGNYATFVVPHPVFASPTAVTQVVPVRFGLRVPGGAVLTKGHVYSEPIVYTASSPLP